MVLDSSILVSMLRQHRDLREEARETVEGKMELVTLDLVKYELERLIRAGASSETSKMASLALQNLENWGVRIVEAPTGPRDVDLAMTIYALTEKGRVIVATLDEELLGTLARNRIPSLRPKHQSGLLASWKT